MHSYRQDQRDRVLANENGPQTVDTTGVDPSTNVASFSGGLENTAIGAVTPAVGNFLELDGTTITASNALITATTTPANAAASGTAGTIAWDASFIYVCVANSTWKRVAIATWP